MSEQVQKKAAFVVEWRDGFKINITQVDNEHKHLFELVKNADRLWHRLQPFRKYYLYVFQKALPLTLGFFYAVV